MNVLLFSDVPPSTNYSSGIVLNKLCSFLLDEGHQVNCFTCMNPELMPLIPEDKIRRMEFANVDKPNENWGSDATYSRRMNQKMAIEVLPHITEAAVAFAKKTKAEMLWIVEQGQSIILQARALAKATKLPYVIQTWDSPQWWMRANCYDELTQKEVMEEYGHALEESECFIAASWIMEKEFKEKYNCKRSKAVVLGFPENTTVKPYSKKKDTFTIAIAGQIYAVEEYQALLRGIHLLNWKYRGKTIYLDIYGETIPKISSIYEGHANIRIRGRFSQDELLKELEQADLLYCPYWFDPDYEVIAHTSFPSKLSTYLSIKRPVVVHGPAYASPLLFVKENHAGYYWDKLNEEYIAQEICKIIDDANVHKIINNGTKAFKRYLTEEYMRRSFFEALGISIQNTNYSEAERKALNVIHVNNIDMIGNRFNGYDMLKACSNRQDIHFKQVVLDKMSDDDNIISLMSNDAIRQVRQLCDDYEQYNSMRALVQPFGRLIRRTNAYTQADVVHYHLLHNGVMSFADLPNMAKEKPSVLTVHDPWITTGHCIYPMECKLWKTGCKKCKYLDRHFAMKEDNAHLMWKIRKKLFENIDIDLIVASKWMERIVKESPITGQVKRIHRIPFGIDLDLFSKCAEIRETRRKYSINPDNYVVMFRQDASVYKGMPYIVEALMRIPQKHRITVLTIGATGLLDKIKEHVGQLIEFEWVTDSKLVAELYSCCDVFLMPSMAEAFGLMAIEAMASSKPIVVFEGTSLPEVTQAPEIGIAVPQKDINAIARAIQRLMENPEEAQKRGEMGRKLCEREYQFKDYVERHIELYWDIFNRKKSK